MTAGNIRPPNKMRPNTAGNRRSYDLNQNHNQNQNQGANHGAYGGGNERGFGGGITGQGAYGLGGNERGIMGESAFDNDSPSPSILNLPQVLPKNAFTKRLDDINKKLLKIKKLRAELSGSAVDRHSSGNKNNKKPMVQIVSEKSELTTISAHVYDINGDRDMDRDRDR